MSDGEKKAISGRIDVPHENIEVVVTGNPDVVIAVALAVQRRIRNNTANGDPNTLPDETNED